MNSEEVRWPQSGRIIICRQRRHHTYSLFTITSTFDYPSVCLRQPAPLSGEPFAGDHKGRPYIFAGSQVEVVGAGLAPARAPPPFLRAHRDAPLRRQKKLTALRFPESALCFGSPAAA